VFKRELHGFAWGLSRAELRSATEFAILAFVVYPLLPAGALTVGGPEFGVSVEPRVVWLMVVFVAGLGIVNYAVVTTYGGRGVAITGFFGGLASSTAVVGTMREYVDRRSAGTGYGVAAILLADAAMALRNLLIVLVFTATTPAGVLTDVTVPLGAIVAASAVVAALAADWREQVPMELETPFSLQNALGFGALFLLVVVAGGVADATLGRLGFFLTAGLSGLVSSAGATTSAVVLYRGGTLDAGGAVVAVLLATLASVTVKAVLAATSSNRQFSRAVAVWSGVLLVVGAVGAVLVL
jgi:uncharacterized membrane protein (DUF4010 family)